MALKSVRTFYLGTKYSQAMNATYLDATGEQHPMEMGCYGIGITRTVAAAIEQNHDDAGIVWPKPLAPADIHIVPVNWNDDTTRKAAEDVYVRLRQSGTDVLFDDREERPGVKFKDADLLGIPLRATIGGKSLARGVIELKDRADGAMTEVPADRAVETIQQALNNTETA